MERPPLITPALHEASNDYSEALLSSINKASRRVMIETMVLDSNGRSGEVLSSCKDASRRGVAVMVIYDRYSRLRSLGAGGPSALKRLDRDVEDLDDAGVTLHTVGKKEVNPFAGRHHVKAAVIDDHVYVGGGINMIGYSFETNDFMLRYDDSSLAQTLYDVLPEIAVSRESDRIIHSDDRNEILVDAGNRNESLIYERTCQLAKDAIKIHYISKLAPDGRLLGLLEDKESQYWFNSTKSATGFDKLAILIDQSKVALTNNYQGDETLHAKFCVFEMPDGSKEAITGSHNFNSRGVKFGTQEIAIHTKDQKLCDELLQFARKL